MKKFLLVMLVLSVVGIVTAIRNTVDAKPIPIPEPSTDPAVAFPQYDKIYREEGHMFTHGNSDWAVYEYLKFHANGMVMQTTRSVNSFGELTDRYYRKLGEELAVNGEGNLRRRGQFTVEEGTVTFTLGEQFTRIPKGTPVDKPVRWYSAEIKGDQIHVSQARADTGEPYGSPKPYVPVGAEAHWDTMPKNK